MAKTCYKKPPRNGLRIDPERSCIYLACCDCGLVHKVFIVRHRKGRDVTLRMYRDNRRTGQRRRWHFS